MVVVEGIIRGGAGSAVILEEVGAAFGDAEVCEAARLTGRRGQNRESLPRTFDTASRRQSAEPSRCRSLGLGAPEAKGQPHAENRHAVRECGSVLNG